MGEHLDDAKGRAKEAVGDLTDDDELKREGKVDRAASTVRGKVDDVTDKAEELVDKARDKADDTFGRK